MHVAKTKFVKGIGSFNEQGENLEEVSKPKEALLRHWPTDAHFVTYETAGPRYRKPIAELKTVKTEFLVFDCDNEEHKPWHDKNDIIAWFDKAAALLPQFWCIYTTRAGGRIILHLKYKIEVRTAEALHGIMVRELNSKGLNVDPNCSDWTRLFRLPYVIRDGEPTWKDPFVDIVFQEAKRYLPKASIPTPNRKRGKAFTIPQPGPEARELVWLD